MKKGLVLILFLLSIALVAGCTQSAPKESDAGASQEFPAPPAVPSQPEMAVEHTVEVTSAGFNPSTITVKAGEAVTFVNKDSAQHWPASAMHPTHKVYPGSDIEKCGTAEAPMIFDACKGMAQGESFKFTFNEKGTWNYHDHLNCCDKPAFFGKVVVN